MNAFASPVDVSLSCGSPNPCADVRVSKNKRALPSVTAVVTKNPPAIRSSLPTTRYKRIPFAQQRAPVGRHVDAWEKMESEQGEHLLDLWVKGM